MFQKHTGHVVAAALLLSLCSQPMMSHASEQAASTPQSITAPVHQSKIKRSAEVSFETLRTDAKSKVSDGQQWIKEKKRDYNIGTPIKDLSVKIDRFQDSVKPAGRPMKVWLKQRIPAKGMIEFGDRSMSAAGILLIMAFGIVFFLMSASSPASRLGGRH